jgi:hypothetical protein
VPRKQEQAVEVLQFQEKEHSIAHFMVAILLADAMSVHELYVLLPVLAPGVTTW